MKSSLLDFTKALDKENISIDSFVSMLVFVYEKLSKEHQERIFLSKNKSLDFLEREPDLYEKY